MKQFKITGCIGLLLLIIISSCTKMDAYKSIYMAGGPIVYPGKMDSVKILSGKNRVQVTGLFTSDPKIVKYRVFWNSKQDSIEMPIKRTAGVDTAKVFITNLPEGLMSFEIRTYDVANNSSVPVNVSAAVYGDLYQSSLVNRGIASMVLGVNSAATINWADINQDAGMAGIEIKYVDSSNNNKDTMITSSVTGLVTVLPIFQQGNNFSYSTAYLPSPTAIDTFFVTSSNADNLYLMNMGNPFVAATSWYRWGILAGWTTSASVINHWGMGGWCADQGGCIAMEMGWGWTPPIINGKIYETMMLDAGTYNFTIVMARNESIDPVYIVAAAGNTLPDVANISTSLGYTGFQNLNLQFTVTKRQQVSIGFLSTMTTGNQFWIVKSVGLTHN